MSVNPNYLRREMADTKLMRRENGIYECLPAVTDAV